MTDGATAFAAREVAVYNSEDDMWYRLGDEPWKVRDAVKGQPAHEVLRVKALTYGEAFEMLFGHPVPLPAQTKNPRRGEVE